MLGALHRFAQHCQHNLRLVKEEGGGQIAVDRMLQALDVTQVELLAGLSEWQEINTFVEVGAVGCCVVQLLTMQTVCKRSKDDHRVLQILQAIGDLLVGYQCPVFCKPSYSICPAAHTSSTSWHHRGEPVGLSKNITHQLQRILDRQLSKIDTTNINDIVEWSRYMLNVIQTSEEAVALGWADKWRSLVIMALQSRTEAVSHPGLFFCPD